MNACSNALVFDWNCTLLDDFEILHSCMNIILERVGRDPITAEHFRTHYDVPFERLYLNLGFGEHEIENVMKVNRIFNDHYEPLAVTAELRAGAIEILERARQHGTKTIVLSNHITGSIRSQLERLGILHLFDDVLAYADRETQFRDMSKGERLRLYMEKQGFTPARAMIVGDSLEEIEIAKMQGLISVAITGGGATEERLRAAKPDYLIHALPELAPILEKQGFLT